jgi:hypothetical protein
VGVDRRAQLDQVGHLGDRDEINKRIDGSYG